MKKIYYVIVALLFIQLSSAAQETNSRIRELGINLSGSTFGVRYKTGKENTLFRFTLLSLSGSSSNQKSLNDVETRNSSLGLGFNFGIEKRKLVSENFNIYFGSDLLTSCQRTIRKYNSPTSSNTTTDLTYSPGLGLLLGFNYKINSKINISAEVVPSITYSYTESSTDSNGTTTKTSTSLFNYGLRTSGVNLTLSFNIGK